MSNKESNSDNNDLLPISPEALASFQNNREFIINETLHRSLKVDQDVEHHGEKAHEIIKKGLEFTTKMLEAAMSVGEIALLEDELKWAKDRLPHDGVEMGHVLSRFKIYRNVVMETMPAEHGVEVAKYIDEMIKQLQYEL